MNFITLSLSDTILCLFVARTADSPEFAASLRKFSTQACWHQETEKLAAAQNYGTNSLPDAPARDTLQENADLIENHLQENCKFEFWSCHAKFA